MVKKSKDGNTWYILLILLLVVCIFGGIVAYYFKFNLIENFLTNTIMIEYYYMENCGHCKSFENTWNEFINKKSSKYSCIKYNILEGDGKERSKKFNISGTPTVIATKNDKLLNTLESNKRSLEDLIEFADKNSIK